jgi:hypothetical protein
MINPKNTQDEIELLNTRLRDANNLVAKLIAKENILKYILNLETNGNNFWIEWAEIISELRVTNPELFIKEK